MINKLLNTVVASAALVAVIGSASIAKAGDYRDYGSLKDPVLIPAPVAASGNCYLRGDTGYGWAGETNSYFYSEVTANVNDSHPSGSLGNEDRSGNWLFEVGVGCGVGGASSRLGLSGVRVDMTLGYRTSSEISGIVPGFASGNSVKTDVVTYSQMFNLYKDFNAVGRFTPYIGVGLGLAYHQMDHVDVDQGSFRYTIQGDEDLNLAWSLMAGFSVDLTHKVKFDLGYRYSDMGSVDSNHDLIALVGAPTADPYLESDMTAHELKFGLRYQLDELF